MANNSQKSQDLADCPEQEKLVDEDKGSIGSKMFSSEAQRDIQAAIHQVQSDEQRIANYNEGTETTASTKASKEANQLPSSKEEKTPGGGTKELVGYCCKVIHLSDAELVVPDLAPNPPNMVVGCSLDFCMDTLTKSFDNENDRRESI